MRCMSELQTYVCTLKGEKCMPSVLRATDKICTCACHLHVSSRTFLNDLREILHMKWTTASNWLFSLIWDQFLPYDLWFWLKGKLGKTATSFPKFTTRFKRL